MEEPDLTWKDMKFTRQSKGEKGFPDMFIAEIQEMAWNIWGTIFWQVRNTTENSRKWSWRGRAFQAMLSSIYSNLNTTSGKPLKDVKKGE